MSIEPPTATTALPGDDDDWFLLVLRAKESGNWAPLVRWMANHPERAEEVARGLDAEGGVEAALRPTPAQPTPGAVFGGLELREQIGEGTSGDVHLAFDPVLKRDVAVKLLRAGGRLSAQELVAFRVEAERAASLNHPNIVRILAFGEERGEPFLVMPLMEGGSLAKRLKDLGPDRRRPAEEAAELVRDIALGVHHAHQRGLIHRDLKPGNILLDKDGQPHVADFGLARPADATASQAAGTPAYMAPEQARGEKHLTTQADVHALGAILFELLAGSSPFAGENVASVMRRVIDEPAPLVRTFRPDVHRGLEAVCLKCLEKNPVKRYPSAQALAEDLQRFLNGEQVEAQPPGVWDWLRQLSRIRPEPTANPFWRVPAWFGAVVLATNAVIYGLVRTGGTTADVWAVNVGCGVSLAVILWWYMLRRFRELTVSDRHSLIIAVGKVFVYLSITAAFVPLSSDIPASHALGMFPALAAASGLVLFVLGSTSWSRFFPIGVGFMALAPVFVRWPEAAPLVYGGTLAVVLWYWAYVKGAGFAPLRDLTTAAV